MRRGRPTAQNQQLTVSQKATPAGSRGTSSDPFAALDSEDRAVRAAAVDELQSKWPSLEEFSLLHDRGTKFEFGPGAPGDPKQESLNKRVAEALADEAFGQSRPTKPELPASKTTASITISDSLRKTRSIEPEPQQAASRSQPSLVHEPTPKRPQMVSTGIQTSPHSTPPPAKRTSISDRPIWRVPSKSPATSKPADWLESSTEPELPPRPEPAPRPNILQRHRTKSQTTMNLNVPSSMPKSPASSRPSLEGQRPSALDLSDSISRSKSANARPRPSSLYVESNLDYLRDRETARSNRLSAGLQNKFDPSKQGPAVADESSDDDALEDPSESDLAFLRSRESDEPSKRKSRRSSANHKKRSSLGSISLSNTKNIIAGRFGDAFRRFEGNSSNAPEPRTPSPLPDREPLRGSTLTPIAGSEATGTSGRSDDEALDETEDISPEMRRELERRRLSQEEKRVAAAAEEYKRRLEQGGRAATGPSKVSSIQHRIKALTDESRNAPPPTRTAEGYGHFTDIPKVEQTPAIARKPIGVSVPRDGDRKAIAARSAPPTSAPSTSTLQTAHRTGPRPNVAPKPQKLRTGTGTLDNPAARTQTVEGEDLEAAFAKRYPSLAGLEMVEMEIGSDTRPSSGRQAPSALRVRDV
jgi:AP2-associated kinase